MQACVVAEELGRARDRSTWWGNVVAAAAVAGAPEAIEEQWLPGLLAGASTAAVIAAGSTRVIRADAVDVMIALTRNGIHLIDAATVPRRHLDGDLLDIDRPVWSIDIDDAPSVLIGGPERAARHSAVARLLVAADSLGAVSMTLERLTSYLRERVAFGAPIASFQAIQHRLVELFVFEVKARAVVMKGARAAAAGDERMTALSAVAHAFVCAKATAAVDECMQLSGGIGFTWEYPLHHELRRVFTNAHLIGSPRSSRALLAEVSGW